jgi:hypothetical protein
MIENDLEVHEISLPVIDAYIRMWCKRVEDGNCAAIPEGEDDEVREAWAQGMALGLWDILRFSTMQGIQLHNRQEGNEGPFLSFDAIEVAFLNLHEQDKLSSQETTEASIDNLYRELTSSMTV